MTKFYNLDVIISVGYRVKSQRGVQFRIQATKRLKEYLIKGFNRRGLYRMKQFYELYKDDEKVSMLLTQLNWSNHLKIMSGSKARKREFYIELAVREKYSKRELERQMDSGYYERYRLSNDEKLPLN